jgi:alpha-amylase
VWKVAINDGWSENYGCSGLGGPNCAFTSNSDGEIRFKFNPSTNPPQLSVDLNVNNCANGPCNGITTQAPGVTTVTTPTGCPTTAFTPKIVRASGDWSLDAGSGPIWNGAEPLGLMTLEAGTCNYVVIVKGLKPNTSYKWKVTINNAWAENYGCSGSNGPDCSFKSSSGGAVRFIMKVASPPQLTTDYNVAPCGDGICETGESCSYCPQDCGECPPPVCGDGICEEGESFTTCPDDCVNELPGCAIFNDESCKSGSQISANDGVSVRRWQTPKPGSKNYLDSFQHYYALVGYADIRYTTKARIEADVCIIAKHKEAGKVTLTYIFDGVSQSSNCKRYTTSKSNLVSLKVTGSDGTELEIPSITLAWNITPLKIRTGGDIIYRNGQKGAVPEMFGWPHKDVMEECALLGKAGYLGVKLFPVHEQLMSTQPFNDALNPWYFMYQPVSYKLDGRSGTREELEQLIRVCRGEGVRVYVDAILNHFTGAGNDLHDHRNPSAGCSPWGNKTSSAPLHRQSPFYTHAYTYKYNQNTGAIPSNEFPGAALGPDDFHCDRSLGSWSDLFILNNGWLVGLTDIDTSKENVRERQAAYLVEMLSMGISK